MNINFCRMYFKYTFTQLKPLPLFFNFQEYFATYFPCYEITINNTQNCVYFFVCKDTMECCMRMWLFPPVAGGVNQSRWQHGRLAGPQTDRYWSCHFPCLAGGEFAPHKHREQLFWKWPLIQAATVQLSGTMTEDDGFCCRGGICQTPRWKKGV